MLRLGLFQNNHIRIGKFGAEIEQTFVLGLVDFWSVHLPCYPPLLFASASWVLEAKVLLWGMNFKSLWASLPVVSGSWLFISLIPRTPVDLVSASSRFRRFHFLCIIYWTILIQVSQVRPPFKILWSRRSWSSPPTTPMTPLAIMSPSKLRLFPYLKNNQ